MDIINIILETSKENNIEENNTLIFNTRNIYKVLGLKNFKKENKLNNRNYRTNKNNNIPIGKFIFIIMNNRKDFNRNFGKNNNEEFLKLGRTKNTNTNTAIINSATLIFTTIQISYILSAII